MTDIRTVLKQQFGFDQFRPGQRQAVEAIVQGESAAAIFPTGAGKSLCYQLPALLEPGMTLVVSPLLSLMKDQIDFLDSKNIAAAKLDSGMSPQEYNNTLENARSGRLKILMIAVERFKNERFRTRLSQMNISLIVVDEAHCISEWGHNFRPDYLKIPIYAKTFNIQKALLLTATATPKVVADMCDKFAIHQDHVVQTGFFRPNLMLQVLPVAEDKKSVRLFDLLSQEPSGPAIVYVTLQKTAERVAAVLSQKGLAAQAYHAGMKPEQRDSVQNFFMENKINIVVATIAFGMGIDKDNIRKVIHFDLPKSIESYSQEIGRAGRDGLKSLCCVLANRTGVPVLENFVYGDTPGFESIHRVLQSIAASDGNVFKLRARAISRETDIRPLPLKTLMVYLEMLNIISPRFTYFETYSFKYRVSEKKIVARFEGERQQFVAAIFKQAKTAVKWTHVDIDTVIEKTGATRQRILTALEYFDEKQWIDLQPKSGVEVFDILNPDFDLDATARSLANLFAKKEKKDVSRLHAMIAMLESKKCLAKELSAYFGEILEQDCGQCSVCRGQFAVLPSQESGNLDAFDYQGLIQPLTTHKSPLQVRSVARFLCGISSPFLNRVKARQMKGFGRLESFGYKAVEKWVKDQWVTAQEPSPSKEDAASE